MLGGRIPAGIQVGWSKSDKPAVFRATAAFVACYAILLASQTGKCISQTLFGMSQTPLGTYQRPFGRYQASFGTYQTSFGRHQMLFGRYRTPIGRYQKSFGSSRAVILREVGMLWELAGRIGRVPYVIWTPL